jgi:UDP-hydrolysing UDP-N-acetyl-D-glucosamine 2-epimerase
MRTIGIITVSRSDFGIYTPVLRAIEQRSDLESRLYVSGAHLSSDFGLTGKSIEADGFDIHERIEMLLSSDTPTGIAKSMGLGTIGFADAFMRGRPDLLVALGDRFEMHSAVVAAMPLRIPVAHIHGGELSEGAIDDALRHSITKLSHLHFVATADYARRVIQLGEEPWRVTVSGAPSLDNLKTIDWLSRPELEEKFRLDLSKPFLLATFHPVTLEEEQTGEQIRNFLSALKTLEMPVVFTYPGADAQSHFIIEAIEQYAKEHRFAQLAVSLGTRAYFSMMKIAAAMVGNSSSGIIEAASFQLPVVNIGNRQRGRIRAANVIDVGFSSSEVLSGIKRAIDPAFRAGLATLQNPYGDGNAAEKIVKALASVEINQKLLMKRFQDA